MYRAPILLGNLVNLIPYIYPAKTPRLGGEMLLFRNILPRYFNMPWLSRSNSGHDGGYDGSRHDSRHGMAKPVPSVAFPLHSVAPSKHTGSVTFIPAMIDGSCGTSPSNFRKTPIRILGDQSRIVFLNLGWAADMLRSLGSLSFTKSFLGSWVDIRDACLQLMLVAVGIFGLFMAVPAFMFLPGVLFGPLCVMMAFSIAALSYPLKGERVVRSNAEDNLRQLDEFIDERWVYINGSMTSHRQLHSQINTLSSIFSRPITGVHNRTNGLVLDMLEMLVARSFLLSTPIDTTLYSQLRDNLLNISVRKVVVLSHGTGAAILSSVLDRLHADLPVDVMSKLEIYTFGSAATNLSNPCLALESPMNPNAPITRADGSMVSPVKAALASRGYRTEDTERVIPHIEHYALATDLFARCGILHHTRSVLDNRFCGRVFVFNPPRHSGFLFSQYLEALFPQNMNRNGAWSILDEKVEVDIKTAEKREFTAQGVSMPLKSVSKRHSAGGSPSPERSPRSTSSNDSFVSANGGMISKAEKRGSWSSAVLGSGMDSVEQARISAKEAEGRTVRQLSRLWLYTGGQKPAGEGVSVVNGVGANLSGMGA